MYHCMKLVRERISYHIFHRPLILPNEIRISAIKLFKWISQAFHFIALRQESVNQKFMAISKVIIIWAAPCISYQLGNINTIWRARCDIARKEWKIDNVEIVDTKRCDLMLNGTFCNWIEKRRLLTLRAPRGGGGGGRKRPTPRFFLCSIC